MSLDTVGQLWTFPHVCLVLRISSAYHSNVPLSFCSACEVFQSLACRNRAKVL